MKLTKYLLFFTILFNMSLFAGSEKLVQKMNYENSYEKAIAKAKKINKPLMMVVGIDGCPWCNKFEAKVLTRKSIDKIVQKNFIPLSVEKEKDTFPKQFKLNGVPFVLFIEPKKQKMFYKSFGYKSKREFKTELDKAIEISQNKN